MKEWGFLTQDKIQGTIALEMGNFKNMGKSTD